MITEQEFIIYKKVSRELSDMEEREVLPCIRVNSDGSTTLINCKTGEEIKPKTPTE